MTTSECFEVNRWFFDLEFIRRKYPEANSFSDNSIVSQILEPSNASPFDPNPIFQSDYYRRTFDETIEKQNPVLHFLIEGMGKGVSPNPCFDTLYYLKQHPESGLSAKDALQDALARLNRNDKLSSFHPLINGQFLKNSYDAEVSVDYYHKLFGGNFDVPYSAELFPEFDPGYWRSQSNEPPPVGANKIVLRQHYLKVGYPSGKLPNWLISDSYIAGQIKLQSVSDVNPIHYYFHSGWNKRKRIVVALHSFQDNPGNRAWLKLLGSQLADPEIEVVIVGQTSGPLSKEFRKVSHVWQVPKSHNSESFADTLQTSIRRFYETLQSNLPMVTFVEADNDLQLVSTMKLVGSPMVLFGGTGLINITQEDIEHLHSCTDLIWNLSEHANGHLQNLFKETEMRVCKGFCPKPQLGAITRKLLGIRSETMVVVGSGALNIESGVDVFGAIAAELFADATGELDLKFIWQGTGSKNPNTPAFYAQYLVDIQAGPGKMHVLTDVDAQSALAIADIYLDTKRCCADDVVSDLITTDKPMLVMGGDTNPKESNLDSFDPYDIKQAVQKLRKLIDNCRFKNQANGYAFTGLSNNLAISHFEYSFNQCLKSKEIDIEFIAQKITPNNRTVLVLTEQSLWNKVLWCGSMTSYVGLPNSIQLKREKLKGVGVSSKILEFMYQEDGHDFVFCCVDAIVPDNIDDRFDRVIGVFESDEIELKKVGNLGVACNKLGVSSSKLISAMEQLNPGVASRMTHIEEEVEWAEAC